VQDIVSEAVVIEKEFLTDALPCALIGINAGVGLGFTVVPEKLIIGSSCANTSSLLPIV